MNSLIWKGVSSTTIKGLLICELPPITKPQMRVNETVIDGRDGSMFEELGYSSYDKAVQIGLRGDYDIDNVIKYFTGEGEIIFSNEPTKVYFARICSQIDYNRLIRYRQATVVFRVQPFKHKYNEAIRETPSAIVSGTSIVVNDGEEAHLKAFKIYGKSTQNGTPTPDAPVDIVSIGDDGSTYLQVCGKNLVKLEDGGYIASSGVADSMSSYQRTTKFHILKGEKIIWSDSNGTVPTDILQWKENGEYIGSYSYSNGGFETVSSDAYWVAVNYYLGNRKKLEWCQIEVGTIATSYEKNIDVQTINLTNTLKAIPVTDKSLATYTDGSGKMWCADEIDLDRGVYIQRVYKHQITDAEKQYIGFVEATTGNTFLIGTQITSAIPKPINNNENTLVISNIAKGIPYNSRGNKDFVSVYSAEGTSFYFRDTVSNTITLDEFKRKNIVFAYILATPIETPLTDDEIAACKSLKANNPTTTILNDENAYMMVEYIKPFEVMNEGLEPSKPIMTLNGSGTVEISVNGVGVFSYTFPDGENEVVIDSEKQDAYLGNVFKNRNMIGEFPILQPKTNRIRWSGDIKSIKVCPRSRWL